jgi:hypothetical protein
MSKGKGVDGPENNSVNSGKYGVDGLIQEGVHGERSVEMLLVRKKDSNRFSVFMKLGETDDPAFIEKKRIRSAFVYWEENKEE